MLISLELIFHSFCRTGLEQCFSKLVSRNPGDSPYYGYLLLHQKTLKLETGRELSRAYGLATHPEMSAAADLLLKTTLWTTWTTTRTSKADSVFSTPAARKPATINGSIPFPYYMWYSTISMYPTLDPLPSPRTRPCMPHPHPTFRLPRPRLHKLLIPIRFFTNTLQSVQVPLLTVNVHL